MSPNFFPQFTMAYDDLELDPLVGDSRFIPGSETDVEPSFEGVPTKTLSNGDVVAHPSFADFPSPEGTLVDLQRSFHGELVIEDRSDGTEDESEEGELDM